MNDFFSAKTGRFGNALSEAEMVARPVSIIQNNIEPDLSNLPRYHNPSHNPNEIKTIVRTDLAEAEKAPGALPAQYGSRSETSREEGMATHGEVNILPSHGHSGMNNIKIAKRGAGMLVCIGFAQTDEDLFSPVQISPWARFDDKDLRIGSAFRNSSSCDLN